MTNHHTTPKVYLRVTYYDRKLSHKGQGVQALSFPDTEEGMQRAKEFAEKNVLYSEPCKVMRVRLEDI